MKKEKGPRTLHMQDTSKQPVWLLINVKLKEQRLEREVKLSGHSIRAFYGQQEKH